MSQLPLGMDMLKQFWSSAAVPSANAGAAATVSPFPPISPAMSPFTQTTTPALGDALTQYMMPTLDVAELDRRMADLKTVLQWMELNTNLLRGNLHTLELQRNTIATIAGMMAHPSVNAQTTKVQTTDAQAAGSKDNTESKSTEPAAAPWLAAWQQMMQQGAELTKSNLASAHASAASASGSKPAKAKAPAPSPAPKVAATKDAATKPSSKANPRQAK